MAPPLPARIGMFAGLAFAVWLLALVALPGDPLVRGVGASLGAGVAANWLCVRAFGTGSWADFGLGWDARSLAARGARARAGLGGGGRFVRRRGLERGARLEGAEMAQGRAGTVLLLAAGAAGEELLFRGYGFQAAAAARPAWAILGSGSLFGLAHVALNSHIGPLGTFNTALWGALLGYACWRSGALWLPIGLHFGWNLGLVATGQALSGTIIEAPAVRLVWTAGEWWSGGGYGPEGGLPTAVLAVVLFAVLRRGR